MLITILATAAATLTPQSFPAASTWGAGIDRGMLHAALRAPERPRIGRETTYCLIDDVTRSGDPRLVCRTQRDWSHYGIQPVI